MQLFQLHLMLQRIGHSALSLQMSVISRRAEVAGHLEALQALSLVHALQLERTSSTPLKTPHSARMQDMVAKVATVLGTGFQAQVLSLVVITLTLVLEIHATPTAWLLVPTMCQQLRSTLPARLQSTHLHLAKGAALRVATASLIHLTKSEQLPQGPFVAKQTSCRSW